jgi:hypothetical protein
MKSEVLSLIAGFFALSAVVFAYFTKKKSFYLFFQLVCIIFLIISYFFNLQFFAMIGLSIGLCRTLTFFLFEKKGKFAPIYVSCIFGTATIASYFIVNFAILKDAQPLDILCLSALVMYAFIFRIRNLKIVRYTMLLPTLLSILFNILTGAAIFATMSYVFELGANIVSIFKYHVFAKPEQNSKELESVQSNEL